MREGLGQSRGCRIWFLSLQGAPRACPSVLQWVPMLGKCRGLGSRGPQTGGGWTWCCQLSKKHPGLQRSPHPGEVARSPGAVELAAPAWELLWPSEVLPFSFRPPPSPPLLPPSLCHSLSILLDTEMKNSQHPHPHWASMNLKSDRTT